MSNSARAIIIRNNKLLVMERFNDGRHYYTLIGGAIEAGETKTQALVREVKEETGLVIAKFRHVYSERPTEKFGTQYIYLCDDPGGKIKLQPDSIEAKLNGQGVNIFSPTWLDIDKLAGVPLMSPKIKQIIASAVKNTFPSAPVLL